LNPSDAFGNLKPVKLESLFSKRDIYRELISDKEILRALHERFQGNIPPDFDSLLEVIEREGGILFQHNRYLISADFTQNFAFARVNGENITVEIAFPAHHRTDSENLSRHLIFKIPAILGDDLSKASRLQAGFLSSDSKRLFGDEKTKFQFGCR
jgi:hypothetical protein